MAELNEFKEKMIRTTEVLSTQFAAVRAGRANAAVLDQIEVEYYGTPTPIKQIASIASPDARTLLIQPWDASALKNIEKAILVSDLGINPQNDGRSIRLVFPQLTEERRKELAKQVRKYGEEAKVAVRNVRRDAMDKFKKQQKKSEITEDDLKDLEKDLQNRHQGCKREDVEPLAEEVEYDRPSQVWLIGAEIASDNLEKLFDHRRILFLLMRADCISSGMTCFTASAMIFSMRSRI